LSVEADMKHSSFSAKMACCISLDELLTLIDKTMF